MNASVLSVARSLLVMLLLGAASAAAEPDGRAVYERWCAGCHHDGPFAPGTMVLKATRGAGRAILAERTDLAPDYIRQLVRLGYAGMPSFRRTEIGEAELDRLVAWLTTDAGEREPR